LKIRQFTISVFVFTITIICLIIVVSFKEKKSSKEIVIKKNKIVLIEKNDFEKDTVLSISGFKVEIRAPKIVKYDLLLLPGWNFKRKLWCDSSNICKIAMLNGFRLIMPEMEKSIYASNYFPETRRDWKKYPTLTWVTDTLIPYLQKNNNVFNSKNNFIIGNSTGGRGAILIAIKTGTLFIAGASLSGDFDQTKMVNDNLIRGVYGDYQKFKNRWKTIDNPMEQKNNLKTPFYFAHGTNDKIVPYSQTKIFYDSINKLKPQLKCVMNSTPMGHNFKFWNSQLDSIFVFFQNNMTNSEILSNTSH
jgi:hypothetical protein